MKVVLGLLVLMLSITQYRLLVVTESLSALKGTIVDVDKVRARFMDQVEYAYGRGCRYGTDYPPEFRVSVGFNPNSPSNYCSDRYKKDMLDYVTSEAISLTE